MANHLVFAILAMCAAIYAAEMRSVAFGSSTEIGFLGQNGEMPLFTNRFQAHRHNPAFLSEITGYETGISIASSDTSSIVSLFYNGKTSPKATFGALLDVSSSGFKKHTSGTFSVSSSSGNTSFGLSTQFMYRNFGRKKNMFNMDVSSGINHTIDQRLCVALAIRNIIGSDLYTDDTTKIEAERSASISVGSFLDKNKRLSLSLEAAIDSLNEWNLNKTTYAAGIEYALFSKKNLKLRAGYLINKTEIDGDYRGKILCGIGSLAPLYGNHFRIEYGTSIPVNDNLRSSIHFATIAFRFQTALDREPPNVSLKASSELLVLGSSKEGTILFYPDADDHNKKPVKNWMLLIGETTSEGKILHIKSWSGTGVPPRVIEWNGRNSAGDPVAKKKYCCRLHAEDNAGNITTLPCLEISVE